MDSTCEGRHAGVLLHPTSLPSKCKIIGDFGASAIPFLDYLQSAGFTYWQVLPIEPCSYSGSQPGCPYLSISSFALNPLLVCPDGLISLGLVSESRVKELVSIWQSRRQNSPNENSVRESGAMQAGAAPGDSFVDFKVAKGYKEELLSIAYQAFLQSPAPPDFQEFCAKNSTWLDGYVLFEAIQARYPEASSWLEWPEEFRDYRQLIKNESILQSLNSLPEEHHKRDNENCLLEVTLLPAFHRFVQFVLAKQWAELRLQANLRGIKIFGDVAFYVNLHSSDVWSNSEMFQMDPVKNTPLFLSGVPPDCFSTEGQLWGHPVYAWEAHARTNYIWWTKRLQHALERFDACRLDHFRGFEAYWRVPYEFAVKYKSAREGEWIKGPGTQLFDAVFKNLGWDNYGVTATTQYDEARKNKKNYLCWWKRSGKSAKQHLGGPILSNVSSGNRISLAPKARLDGSPAPLLVAEDLGLITSEIVALREKYGILSMRVMQFAWDDSEKGLRCEHLPYNHTRDCVVYTGTHDNSTTRSWWDNATAAQRKHLAAYIGLEEEPGSDLINSWLIRLAMMSVAHLVILPVQDILELDDTSRFNRPGVDSPENWCWRLQNLDGLYEDRHLKRIRKLLQLSNRAPSEASSFAALRAASN